MAWRRAREQAVLKPSEEAPGGSASERAEAGQEEADSIKYNKFGGLALAGECGHSVLGWAPKVDVATSPRTRCLTVCT